MTSTERVRRFRERRRGQGLRARERWKAQSGIERAMTGFADGTYEDATLDDLVAADLHDLSDADVIDSSGG